MDTEHPEIEVTRGIDPGQSEPNSFNNQQCAIWIHWPDKSLTKRLLSSCQTIFTFQTVTDFYLRCGYNDRYELSEENTPIISKEAKSLTIYHVDVSSNVLNYLLQNESLEVLCLKHTNVHDAAVPLIFNHRNLKFLNLIGTHMSHEMSEYVCHHLSDLDHLEYINLSFNDLSHVSSIKLSNTTSPVTLNLEWTDMSPELLKSICQLTSVVKLKELELSYNRKFTGHLHYLLAEPHQGLQSLEKLSLWSTKLNKNDIEVLTRAMQRRVLPELKELGLACNEMSTMERDWGADSNLCDSSQEGTATTAVVQFVKRDDRKMEATMSKNTHRTRFLILI